MASSSTAVSDIFSLQLDVLPRIESTIDSHYTASRQLNAQNAPAKRADGNDLPFSFLKFVAILWQLRVPTIDATLTASGERASTIGLSGRGGQFVVDTVYDSHRLVTLNSTQQATSEIAKSAQLSRW
jgi:hypothetical protein